MKPSTQLHKAHVRRKHKGFALVVTLSLMVLLAVIAVGWLSLSAVTLRSGSRDAAQMEARANARLALMIAIGELQKEMGPDMRVSAESAIFDTKMETEAIDGIAQSRWLAAYDSWGDWLNASYTPPNKQKIAKIAQTYAPRRSIMFRRWLLSMPQGKETDIEAPNSLADWNNGNSIVLVGEASLGAGCPADQVTRAYLTPVGETGNIAWWISPENHKARIDKAKKPRTLKTDEWQTAQANTAEVGVGCLAGFDKLDQDETISNKLITLQTLSIAGIEKEKTQQHFFDLTAQSQGVLASVRSGHLKKDLSLLFDHVDGTQLPYPYQFNPASDIREPSIRPMSPEISGRPVIKTRHFASWSNMRHYYRMYRQDSDATVKGTLEGASGGAGSLSWEGVNPVSDSVYNFNTGLSAGSGLPYSNRWQGNNQYWRFPVMAKITYIYSLVTKYISGGNYNCFVVYTPVYTFWNPYNVRLRVPSNFIVISTEPQSSLPIGLDLFFGKKYKGSSQIFDNLKIFRSPLTETSDADRYIVFEPGEFRIFSHTGFPVSGNLGTLFPLRPGFDPGAIGGGQIGLRFGSVTNVKAVDKPGVSIRFDKGQGNNNFYEGNTPGSLNVRCEWNIPPGPRPPRLPMAYQIDWLQKSQQYTQITEDPVKAGNVATKSGNLAFWDFGPGSTKPKPVAYAQLTLKGVAPIDYESIHWEKDWRSRNWIYGAPFYFGHGLYASEDAEDMHTQRVENPYLMTFGPMTMSDMPKVVQHMGKNGFLGSGSNPFEKVAQVAAIELPSAPLSSLAGFSGMRINPGWVNWNGLRLQGQNPSVNWIPGLAFGLGAAPNSSSKAAGDIKAVSYQSGITGPGIGNSFMHPILPRTDVYTFFDNSVSWDFVSFNPPDTYSRNSTNAYCDYWDHVFLLNDSLWDDYFVSSLANQTRPGASAALSLEENLDRLVAGGEISNSRYVFDPRGKSTDEIKAELQLVDGYLKAAGHLVVDGMFNVNSTSIPAWQALFAGIRERQMVYRDKSGQLKKITVPKGKRIALSRFDTEVSDQEMDDPEFGVTMPDGLPGWSGVRFLNDAQLKKLAEECVKQVKKRGPFLNFAEFINRRLSNDALGTMGALQSAIDYDDGSPEADSINYKFKNGPDFMMEQGNLGTHSFKTPEAAVGSRLAGIPGYVIQSDLLKPIANTLAVRDDTFRIRAYGESLDANGNVLARAWCEAIVQRTPDYIDPTNDASVPARLLDLSGGTVEPISENLGTFSDNPELTAINRTFGRKFRMQSFRWLDPSEI